MELVFACRRGKTVLAHAYAEPPLRVGRLLDVGPVAQMILVWCGPGIFAGDRLEQHVRVETGAHVMLVSQAALQVHPGEADSPATIDSSYEVAPDATLDCVWDPMIPFAGSRLRQRVDLRVAGDGQLFWSDALMSGRAARGESWQFDTFDHELRASVGGALTFLERYRLTPRSRRPEHPWSAAQAQYVGTTLACSATATTARAEEAQRRLASIDGLRAGIDCPVPNLVVGRLLAARGPRFASARAALREVFERPAIRRS
jgi:urease accessory protein